MNLLKRERHSEHVSPVRSSLILFLQFSRYKMIMAFTLFFSIWIHSSYVYWLTNKHTNFIPYTLMVIHPIFGWNWFSGLWVQYLWWQTLQNSRRRSKREDKTHMSFYEFLKITIDNVLDTVERPICNWVK